MYPDLRDVFQQNRPEPDCRATKENPASAGFRISENGRVSRPGEFHPEALAEPYVNVSVHTAPIIQLEKEQPMTSVRIDRDDV